MTVDKVVRVVVGLAVTISVLLMHFQSQTWGWVAGIMGLSLAQSGFTNTCPLTFTLRKLGLKESNCDGNRNN